MRRYALYYAPRSDEPLAVFARAWLGRDPETGRACERVELDEIAPDWLCDITADPTHYGFHGTLKAPFELAEGVSEDDLLSRAAAFAGAHGAIRIERISLKAIGGFLALVPHEPSPELNAFAAECVRAFDGFRLPLSEAELTRRRASRLSARQDKLLLQWGYPYVMEEFRFHLTLTGSLDEAERDLIRGVLVDLTADICDAPLPVRDLTIFMQDDRQAPFRILARYPLAGG